MTEEKSRDGMQRIRVGLTGLAVVLLVIALATAFFRMVDRQVVTNSSGNDSVSNKPKDEPLADLGVAPGAAPENATEPETAPPAKR